MEKKNLNTNEKVLVIINLTKIGKAIRENKATAYKSDKGELFITLDIVGNKDGEKKFDHWLGVVCSQTKEQKEAKAEKIWCGHGDVLVFDSVKPKEEVDKNDKVVNDLPF